MEQFLKPSVANTIVDDKGNEYYSARSLAKHLGINKKTILNRLKKGEPFIHDGITYKLKDVIYLEGNVNNETKPIAVVKTEEQKEVERIINSEEYNNGILAENKLITKEHLKHEKTMCLNKKFIDSIHMD